MRKNWLMLMFVGALSACSHAPQTTETAPIIASNGDQCVAEGQWFDLTKRQPISADDALSKIAKHKVVLLGEDHDNIQHHRWQLFTLSALYGKQPNMALGFEAFPRHAQPILDRWVNGELTEKEFLKEVDWQTVWSYDPDYYMPMFHFARMNKIPMYALNVERSLISKVGQQGWESIPVEERQGVTDPAPASEEYKQSLADIFSQHMPGPGGPAGHGKSGDDSEAATPHTINIESPGFQRFIQSQLVWDRSMAEQSKKALEDGASMVVSIVGAGHLMGGYGIPHQLKAMNTPSVISLMPWDGAIDCENLETGLADLAFGMSPPEEQPETQRPRLGIYLEQGEKGVKVRKLVNGSVAEDLGVQAGDEIINIAGTPAKEISDIINAVQKTAFGTWLPFTILRGEEEIELVAKFPPLATN